MVGAGASPFFLFIFSSFFFPLSCMDERRDADESPYDDQGDPINK
jgi:hypothetical protein